jgi:hypothetical protein
MEVMIYSMNNNKNKVIYPLIEAYIILKKYEGIKDFEFPLIPPIGLAGRVGRIANIIGRYVRRQDVE